VETLLGGLGALIVLAIVFGSLLAGVPLVMALVSIPTTFLVIWGLTRITDISSLVQYLVALIGLGLAIDYSLLIVMRWREERARGLDNCAAVQRAMETAGTAVVFSGTTVGIGMLALIALPVPFMRSLGLGGLLIPLVTVLVAITLLPVVLATVGPKFDWPRRKPARTSRFWERWGRLMVRFRWQAALSAIVLLAAVILPAFSITLGSPKADALAHSGDAYIGLQALERSGIGPGPLYPIEILVQNADAQAVAARMGQVAGIRGAIAPAAWRRGQAALVDVFPVNDGTTASATAALNAVRQIAKGLPGSVQVGGMAAGNEDFVSAIYGNFPLMVAILSLLTFLLLARAFRSVLLPLKAVALVLVSVGAATGFITFVWQQGHGSSLLFGVPATGSITLFIPIMVFAFLFGISMDYEVFLLARMREEYDATGSTDVAVVRGIGRTGRLVTSAALILFLAFAALASGPDVVAKTFATGLAAGIILDATVIRMLLVPALVSLFGRWNWWLPAPMARTLGVRTTSTLDADEEEEYALGRTA
jgi:RND superfamily putative drug exporter